MTLKEFILLYRLLAQHRKLEQKRDPMFATNRKGKLVGYIFFALFVLYFLVMAIVFAWMAIHDSTHTTVELLFCFLPFLFVIDFTQRLYRQKTPSQIVRPYLLLPIPRQTVIDAFLLRLILNDNSSLLWLIVISAYSYMAVFFRFGFWCALCCVLFFFLFTKLSSMLYTITRTLADRYFLWWGLPILVAATMIIPIFVFESFQAYLLLGDILTDAPFLTLLGLLTVVFLLFAVNRRVQYAAVMNEAMKKTQTKLRTVSQFSFLDHYGEIGQYLRLEIKSLMRNKNPRRSFFSGVGMVLFISLIITFTTAYDGEMITNYWGFYCFLLLGMALLSRAMSYEANYIDFLMVHHENLLQLITAKYYFCVALLALPLLILLPTVVIGKWSLPMLLAYASFTAGPLYCAMMQMVVYNRVRVDLNEKLIGKNTAESSWIQVLISIGVFIVPVVLVQGLSSLIGPTPTYWITIAIGLAFIFTHRLWLRNIYHRFMRVRYQRIDDYHK